MFRATRLEGNEPVVLKVSPDPDADPTALLRFRHEFRLGSALHHENVVRYLALEPLGERLALVEEDFGGISLGEIADSGSLPLELVLEIGVRIARGLAHIHAEDVIHRAIHPGNILVRPSDGQTRIADFANATVLQHQAVPSLRDESLAMPLAYVSPEQTGRMNRAVDHRTDFYSLGATLFRALAGRPPFEDVDPLALVHAHLARTPPPLSEVDPSVPPVVSRIVEKLLAKDPEDRYQSAGGLLADLTECLRRLRVTGELDDFPIGLADAPERLVIPEKLYGRDAERERLIGEFEAAASGERLLVLVSGPSGVGKSSLVNEVRRPIVERRGFFLSGKFDLLHRTVPYSALRTAVDQLCDELLGESEERLRDWRERILARLGPNAGLIVEIAPALEKILGPQPPPPKTGLVESQHRFTHALQRFFGVFAGEHHPVVLFLDDLQWADPATLHVVESLLGSPQLSHLLLIGAYRDNEVDPTHPLMTTLREAERARVPIRRIELSDLSLADVERLVADTLRAPRKEIRSLARIVFEKTSGSPFFVDEFLRTLGREKLLSFSADTRSWTWDGERIAALGITPNVVDLMLRRLRDLPETTQHALRLGACIGDRFSLSTLAEASGATMIETCARLDPAVRDRLLVPLDATYAFESLPSPTTSSEIAEPPNYRYRFLHDRVRQAAYEMIPARERPRVHLGIGRMLLAETPPERREERAFDLADQLNLGLDLITDPEERLVVAELDLLAGRKARSATAYAEAQRYLHVGMAALPPDAFDRCYDLAYALHLRAAECAYLAGRFEEADAIADALLPRLRSPLEKAEVYTIRIVLEANRTKYERSVALGREALAELGITVPSFRTPLPLLAVYAKASWLKLRRRGEDLASLPELDDARLAAAVGIIEHLIAPSYFMDPKLFFWLIHESLCISLAHGNSVAAAVGYVSYGVLLSAVMGAHAEGETFGRLGLALADRRDGIERRAKLNVMFGIFVHHYRDHARKSLEIARRAIPYGIESGDVVYACYGAANCAEGTLIVGDPLDDVMREADAGQRFARPLRHHDVDVMFVLLQQTVRCLRGETFGVASLSSEHADEAVLVADVKAAEAKIMLAIYIIWKVQLLFLFRRSAEALELVLEFDETVESMTAGQLRLTEYTFYTALACVDCLREGRGDRHRIRKVLRAKTKRLAVWAHNAPMNYLHKQLLVRAELADLEGNASGASKLYERAMHEARAHGYQQNAAIAAELAARSFERRGRIGAARTSFQEARTGYARWGAKALVRALDREHPELARDSLRTSSTTESLDLVSVLRASQAISSEIDLGRLLERTMQLIVENAGAERGVWLVESEGLLRVEAVLDLRSGVLDVLSGAPVEGTGVVSESIARYVFRSGEDVVLSDASKEGSFLRDPYVKAHRSRSIACIPVRHKDRTTGALFLENELTAGAFTRDRLEVLRFLVSQAAISLENARLYDATRSLNQDLRASEARVVAFLEGLPVGVFVLEADGRPSFANRKARELVTQNDDASGEAASILERYRGLVAGSDEPYPSERFPLARALRGETSMVDDLEIHVGERRVPLAMWGTPIRAEDGTVRYAVVAFQDIGPQRAAEEERARLEEQLARAERLESVGRLAGGIAHDFNNLLTPMLVYSELALRRLPPDSAAHAQIHEVHTAAERAAELTRQLLAFGRKQAIDARVVELHEELTEFLRMLRRLVREDVEIVVRQCAVPCRIRADRSQLQRIVMNLAMNAADAMPNGGVLTLETARVTVHEGEAMRSTGAPPGDYVALRVVDTGTGMDPETLGRIFEPFFTTKEPGKGTGLGLATVYGLVAQHQGYVRVESEKGKGSTFEVLFPLVEGEESATPSPRPPASEMLAKGSGTVLVVEDEEAVRSLLVRVLSDEGYDVIATGDPSEALRLAQERGERLDLVISDVVMPKMNGRELKRRLLETRPSLRILFVSGYPDEALSAEGMLAPGVDLLRKPFSTLALRTKVREVLRKRSPA